jgi:hypothetical protein
MPVREVVDRHERRWMIWRVRPGFAERRREIQPEIVDRVGERRRRKEARATVSPEYVDGWLAFETDGERRRLVPVPERWTELTDQELLQLVDQATVLPPRRRLP